MGAGAETVGVAHRFRSPCRYRCRSLLISMETAHLRPGRSEQLSRWISAQSLTARRSGRKRQRREHGVPLQRKTKRRCTINWKRLPWLQLPGQSSRHTCVFPRSAKRLKFSTYSPALVPLSRRTPPAPTPTFSHQKLKEDTPPPPSSTLPHPCLSHLSPSSPRPTFPHPSPARPTFRCLTTHPTFPNPKPTPAPPSHPPPSPHPRPTLPASPSPHTSRLLNTVSLNSTSCSTK